MNLPPPDILLSFSRPSASTDSLKWVRLFISNEPRPTSLIFLFRSIGTNSNVVRCRVWRVRSNLSFASARSIVETISEETYWNWFWSRGLRLVYLYRLGVSMKYPTTSNCYPYGRNRNTFCSEISLLVSHYTSLLLQQTIDRFRNNAVNFYSHERPCLLH